MTLLEAMANTKCDVLRTKLEEFILLVSGRVVDTFFCPVCGTDLRSSYRDQANQEKFPGQGTCEVCHLAIQMRHNVVHEDHMINPVTKEMCEYRITLPVMLLQPVMAKLLHDKWAAMRMPRRRLTMEENGNWIAEAKAMLRRYNTGG